MADRVSQNPLIIQNENLDVHQKKSALNGNIKSSKTATKRGGNGLGNRKALNDITNKTYLHEQAQSQKKNSSKKDFNIAEESFLHDHNKCIKEQQAARNVFLLDLVLSGHGSVSANEHHKDQEAQTDAYSPRCYPEPEDLPMSEFSNWLKLSTKWEFHPSSPMCWDSPPPSPSVLQFEEVKFVLKQENNI